MLAISQTNAKRLLAYSTISNLGLIIACAGLNTPLAIAAAVMLIVFHAISKGLLFMATGVVDHAIGSREIEDMQGLVARMPLTTTLMIIGIFSMLLPPFGVLIAKLAAIEASTNMPAVLLLLVIGSALTMVFWTKWMGCLLTADPHAGDVKIERLHQMYFGPLLLLTAGTIVFSACVIVILRNLVSPAVGAYYASLGHGPGDVPLGSNVLGFPWAPVFGVLAVAVVMPVLFYHMRKGDLRSAYLCGEQVSGARTATFRTVGEANQALTISPHYLDRLAGESRHATWVMLISIVLCVTLIGVGLIR
jgi:ech hydrogenase subunit A